MKKHAMMCVALWGTLVTAAFSREEVIIKVLVDGPSELIVTTNGFQWKNGMNAKPGRHESRNEPTYINETAWYPDWGANDNERGVGTSDVCPWPIKSSQFDFELLAIGDTPDATTVEPRTSPTTSYGADGSMIVSIPDPEPGSKWYVFVVILN